VMTIAVVLGYLLPKKYEAKCTVFIEKNVISELVKGIAVTPSLDDTVKVLTYAISSRTLVSKVLNELNANAKSMSDATLESTIAELQKNTDIKVKDKEGLFIISFNDKNPNFARDYVNTLVRRYIEENLSSKREESYGATTFLSDQIKTFKQKLDSAESELNNFKSDKGAAIAVNEGDIQKEISAGQQRLDDLSVRRSQLEAMRNQLRRNDPVKSRILALQKRLDELRVEYTDNYPEVLKVKADIESAKLEMSRKSNRTSPDSSDVRELEKIEAELRAVRNSEENQRALLATSRSLLREGPGAKASLEKLEQQRNNVKNVYEQLFARHSQAEVSKQMEVQDKTTTFRIVDPAVTPIKPVSPNRVKIILMGIAAGIGLAFAMLVGIDRFDPAIRDIDGLKCMDLPVIAVIPRLRVEEEVRKERRRDFRLYQAAGCYFVVILLILVTEALDLSVVDRVVSLLNS
jgi:succinoglycan biosynthesis transport protein ExoP